MRKTFESVLEKIGTAPSRVVARVPFDPHLAWPQAKSAPGEKGGARPPRSDLRVKGTIRAAGNSARSADAFAFTNSFLGKRQGDYLLVVTQKMQKGACLSPGSRAAIVIEPDLDRSPVTLPPELAKVLKHDREVVKWFGQLAFSVQNYVANLIVEPKSAAARQRRAEDWAERLMLAMEGELETPPVLKAAFRQQPQAEAGWAALTLNRRRLHLILIFSSKSPEARTVRLNAILEESLRAAKRKTRGKSQDSGASPAPQAEVRLSGRERNDNCASDEDQADDRPRKKRRNPWPSGPFGF